MTETRFLPKDFKADIALLCPLDEEFEALKTEFNGNFITSKQSNQQYYISEVVNSTLSKKLKIAIVSLSEMGNAECGIKTTRVIDEIKPKSIILFGLAGAIGEKVEIGDIIIPENIYYYETKKILENQENNRNKILSSDSFLLNSFKNFYRERKEDLKKFQGINVKFGTIAVGEKIIASESFKTELLQYDTKILALEMESYGFYLSTLQHLSKTSYLTFRVISDMADSKKNDAFRSPVLEKAAKLLKLFIIEGDPINYYFDEVRKGRNFQSKFIALHHVSQEYRSFHSSDVMSIYKQLHEDDIEICDIDLTDNYQDGSMRKIKEALLEQNKCIEQIIKKYHVKEKLTVGYFSLAHIPFAFHLGYKLQTIPVQHHIAKRPRRVWQMLPLSNSKFPELIVEGFSLQTDNKVEEVILQMGISVSIKKSQIEEIINTTTYPLIRITAKNTKLEIIESENQLVNYTEIFLETIQRIRKIYPNIKKIHLFFGGQPCLAFMCGQQISKTMDPDFIVYNFSNADRPNYGWGINIKKDEITDFRKIKDKEK